MPKSPGRSSVCADVRGAFCREAKEPTEASEEQPEDKQDDSGLHKGQARPGRSESRLLREAVLAAALTFASAAFMATTAGRLLARRFVPWLARRGHGPAMACEPLVQAVRDHIGLGVNGSARMKDIGML